LQGNTIHHSDAGSGQYTSIHFGETLLLEGLVPSIGTVGDAYDCPRRDDDRAVQDRVLPARITVPTPPATHPRRARGRRRRLGPHTTRVAGTQPSAWSAPTRTHNDCDTLSQPDNHSPSDGVNPNSPIRPSPRTAILLQPLADPPALAPPSARSRASRERPRPLQRPSMDPGTIGVGFGGTAGRRRLRGRTERGSGTIRLREAWW
jgi:hypothetical protein